MRKSTANSLHYITVMASLYLKRSFPLLVFSVQVIKFDFTVALNMVGDNLALIWPGEKPDEIIELVALFTR